MKFSRPPSSANRAARHPTGADAEKMAERFLRRRGLKLVERNFSCRQGEIDLIMMDQDNNTLVLVEVRFRKTRGYGLATETVTANKQRKLIAAAQYYLLQNKNRQQQPVRFDVIGIMPGVADEYEYTWLQNAFES